MFFKFSTLRLLKNYQFLILFYFYNSKIQFIYEFFGTVYFTSPTFCRREELFEKVTNEK